jgi:hypothetical protein
MFNRGTCAVRIAHTPPRLIALTTNNASTYDNKRSLDGCERTTGSYTHFQKYNIVGKNLEPVRVATAFPHPTRPGSEKKCTTFS